jgi:hypothetical protein
MGWSSTVLFQEEITMGNKMAWPLVIILFGVVGLSLLTCAGALAAAAPVKSMPAMLKEAGFRVYPVETDQEKASLKSSPKDTLMIHQHVGTVIYCFADPASNTMYMGNYTAYRNLQDILEKRRQGIKEKTIESDREFWETWGHRYGGI